LITPRARLRRPTLEVTDESPVQFPAGWATVIEPHEVTAVSVARAAAAARRGDPEG
jgi:hypothetical protein